MFVPERIEFESGVVYLLKYNPYAIGDFIHVLTTEERERFYSFQSKKRQYEFLTTRILKEMLFPNKHISYNNYKQPTITGLKYVSISHCIGNTAIATSNLYPIGLDIEPISDKAKRLHSKFLNEYECALLDVKDRHLMTRAWSCKECLVKLSSRFGLIFKQDLLIEDFDGTSIFSCKIKMSPKQTLCVSLTSLVLDNIILTINTSILKAC